MSGSLDTAGASKEPVLLTRRTFIATTATLATAAVLAPSHLAAAPGAV